MRNTLISLLEENGLLPVYERIVRYKPELKKTAKNLNCLQWSYIGIWGEMKRTFEFTTKMKNVFRVGISQGKYHLYKEGEYGSWEYVEQSRRCRNKFGEALGQVLIKAEMDAKGGRFQWPA